jgi:hypothetical protein
MPFSVATTITRDNSGNWPGSPLRSARCRRETLLLKSRIAQFIACWQATTLLPRRLTTAKDHLHLLLHHGPRGLQIDFFPQFAIVTLPSSRGHRLPIVKGDEIMRKQECKVHVYGSALLAQRDQATATLTATSTSIFASIGCLHPPASPQINNPIDNKKRDKIIQTSSAATTSAIKLEDPYTGNHTR